MKRTLLTGFCIVALGAGASFGADTKPASVQKQLAAVPAGELPAQAALLVSGSKPADREATTANVLKAATALRPAACTAVVGAIARTTPDMASTAAGVAAAQQPKLAAAFAKAAAAAAPAKAGAIVTAVCKVAPREFRQVALAVAEAAPGSEKDVLQALGAVFAKLTPSIDQAIRTCTANPASFAAVVTSLNPANGSATDSGLAALPTSGARGPVIAPPYVAPSGTPANYTPTSSGQVPTGGRDYAKP